MERKERTLMTCGLLLLLFLTVVLTLFGAYKIVIAYHDLTYTVLSILAAVGVTAGGYLAILQCTVEPVHFLPARTAA
jgi:hypothetical protein